MNRCGVLVVLFFLIAAISAILVNKKSSEGWRGRGRGWGGRGWHRGGWGPRHPYGWGRGLGRGYWWNNYWPEAYYNNYSEGSPWCYKGRTCYPNSVEELFTCFPEMRTWQLGSPEWGQVSPGIC